MARKIRGAIVEHTGRDGQTYRALRFTAYGRRQFVSLGAVSRGDAERELRYVLTDIERGTWRPPQEANPPPEPEPVPTFHQFAEEWWEQNEPDNPRTRSDYRWRLDHLLGREGALEFAEYPLDQISYRSIEQFIAAKRKEGLSPRSINMTRDLLGRVLERAKKHGLIADNPARDPDLRVRERAPRRTCLHTASEIAALLDAAGEVDAQARPDRRHVHRRAILATLILAGLRIGELTALRWRSVDLAAGWLTVEESKTDAGRGRRVKIRGALRDELGGVRACSADGGPDAFVFATSTGGKPSRENVRNRVLAPAVQRVSERLVKAGYPPLPEGLTPHSLRRTFASLQYALGTDPPNVMREMGHTSPTLALAIYAQAMGREEHERAALRALVDGEQMAVSGIRAPQTPETAVMRQAA